MIYVLVQLTRMYFKQSWVPGREWLWHNWVRPYLLWRSLSFSSRTFFGAKFRTAFPDMIQARIYFFGFWEPAVTAYIASQLRPGDIFIDIGANIGYYSLFASHCVGDEGRVISFEASPTIYSLLIKNLEANSVSNVAARNVAVADGHRHMSIFLGSGENIGQSTTVPELATEVGAALETTVAAYPLGELVDAESLSSARFIKIDVEGAEWLVVKGLQPLLGSLSDSAEIFIEINAVATAQMGGSARGILDIFASAGFSAYEINNSYGIEFYFNPEAPLLTPYDGQEFIQKDFIMKRDPVGRGSGVRVPNLDQC